MNTKRKRIRIILLGVLAVFILGAGSLAAVQAVEGSAFDAARQSATEKVPATANRIQERKDRDAYYFEFTDETAQDHFQVRVDRKDRSRVQVKSQNQNRSGSSQLLLDKQDIIDLVSGQFPDAQISSVSLSQEGDTYLYDVIFVSETARGQYRVNPETGLVIDRVLRYGQPLAIIGLDQAQLEETRKEDVQPQSDPYLTLDEARVLALEQQPGARLQGAKYSEENKRLAIRVFLEDDQYDYTYELDALTGRTLEIEVEARKPAQPLNETTPPVSDPGPSHQSVPAPSTTQKKPGESSSNKPQSTQPKPTQPADKPKPTQPAQTPKETEKTPSQSQAPQLIGFSRVMELVRAKSPGAQFLELELEHKNGRTYYEGDAYANGKKIEFEIDAYTGAILDWEVESVDPQRYEEKTDPRLIGFDRVREIVRGKAPDARFLELELEHKKDRVYYEGDIMTGGLKYEFKVDAYSGEILEWERDN